jgi:hypothetical protein
MCSTFFFDQYNNIAFFVNQIFPFSAYEWQWIRWMVEKTMNPKCTPKKSTSTFLQMKHAFPIPRPHWLLDAKYCSNIIRAISHLTDHSVSMRILCFYW